MGERQVMERTRRLDGMEVPVPGTWVADPAHTTLGFVARHLMVTKVRGRFGEFEGAIHVAERLEDSWAEGVAKAASIDTGVPDRDAHLRSPDFLDVENHPEVRLRLTEFERLEGPRFRVQGELTIRGETRPVTLDATFEGVGTDHTGRARAFFSATGEIDREDWGMRWNVVLEGGGVLVSRKVQLELEVSAILQEDEPASQAD